MKRIHPGENNNNTFRLDSNNFGFIWAMRKQHGNIKQTSDIIWVVCNKLTAHTKKKNCS